MALKFLKHRWQRVAVTLLLILTGLILILGFFINLYWSPILAGKVKDVVLKSSDSLYNINFSSADLHVLRGTIVIFNITLKPDTAIYNRRKKQHLAPNNLIELHVKRLTLSHIHPFKLYFQHRLEIGEIVLNNPELNVSYQLNHTRDTVLKDNRTAWQKISKSLHSIHVGNIELGDVKFRYEDYSGNRVAVSELKEMNLSARDLLIDSATQTDKSRLLYCKDIIAELNNYSAKTASGLYSYKIKSLKLSTLKSQLNIEGLTLQPVKPDVFFGKSRTDRFTLRFDSVQLNNFDFLNYHKYRMLSASSLVLSKGAIGVFSNPHGIPDSTTDRVKTFPNELIHRLNTALRLDTIRVHNIDVTYSEYNKKSSQTGTITFNNTSGRFLNVTTNPEALQKNNISTIQLTSYFMNRGKLDVLFTFNLTDDDKSFSYKGSLGKMDLTVANPATMPLAMVKITSGTIKQLDFDIHANRKGARGKVVVLYNNLKVRILKPDTTFNNLRQRPIASLFANLFIVKHDNPDVPGGQPRLFEVKYARHFTTPFFKFTWQTLLTGIKPAIGLDQKTQDATKALVSKQAIKKQNRKIKKELRKQRRAERRQKRAEKQLGEGS
jgi:hypothetical protein